MHSNDVHEALCLNSEIHGPWVGVKQSFLFFLNPPLLSLDPYIFKIKWSRSCYSYEDLFKSFKLKASLQGVQAIGRATIAK